MNQKEYDLIIIGGGAAGLTAGIYACRGKLDTILLEKLAPGGLTATSGWVENYPGFPQGISGLDLMDKIEEQAKKFGLEIVEADAVSVELEGNIKLVKTKKTEYKGKSVIIATGTQPRKLNVPGEERLRGKGVSYCATCDGPLFKNKEIAVIGTGNSGIQEGLFLLKFARKISFVELLPHMTADKILQERIRKQNNVEFFLNHIPVSINGESKVESITIKDRANNKEKIIPVQGIFLYAGLDPNTGFLKGRLELSKCGFIVADEFTRTAIPGVFAAGDVRSKNLRQIVTAAADGAQAAYMAEKYIENLKAK
ncbi:MAG: thioredoxin-disulfide reductase [candidate division Zixibacteria bacterium]|nr:thioredoxin-disulfide reductase [candidate division Zixibacteria bacterium]